MHSTEPICLSALRVKVSECPLTPFVGLCAGSLEVTLSPTGWLCHKGASGRKWGKAIGGAGWRVRRESRRHLWLQR